MLKNYSSQVKSTLTVKKGKIQNYGKGKEFSPSYLKTKIYQLMKPSSVKYIEVLSVSISWTPTVSHLLEDTSIMVRAYDSRGSFREKGKNDLFLIKKRADISWEFSIPCSISLPFDDLMIGLPILLDLDLHAKGVKTDVEIGKLRISANIISGREVTSFSLGPAEFSYSKEENCGSDVVAWKGMEKSEVCTSDQFLTDNVYRYLDGRISLDQLGESIRKGLKFG